MRNQNSLKKVSVNLILLSIVLILISTLILCPKISQASLRVVFSSCALGVASSEYFANEVLSIISFGSSIPGIDLWISLITSVVIVVSVISLSFYKRSTYSSSLSSLFIVNLIFSLVFFNLYRAIYLYLVFEISVIPIFLMIIGWGYQPERVKASYAIIFYTIITSVPLLTCLTIIISTSLFSEVNVLIRGSESLSISNISSLAVALGFLVKLPMFGVHLWLPLAHVEAPVFGSIILAGVLLKLGGIGIIRFINIIQGVYFKIICISISLVGTVIVGATCLKITDLKSVIAFSSVSHIGIVIFILIISRKLSIWVAFFIILTHAFRSSIMFFCRYVMYTISGTRNILLNKGSLTLVPAFRICWLVATIASIGTPPFINLVSEVFSLFVSWDILGIWIVLIVVMFILGRAFHLILYRSVKQEGIRWDNSNKGSSSNIILPILTSHTHSLLLVLSIIILIEVRY